MLQGHLHLCTLSQQFLAREHLQRVVRRLSGLHCYEYLEGLLLGLCGGRVLAVRSVFFCSVLTGFHGMIPVEVEVVMIEKAMGWEVPQQNPSALHALGCIA